MNMLLLMLTILLVMCWLVEYQIRVICRRGVAFTAGRRDVISIEVKCTEWQRALKADRECQVSRDNVSIGSRAWW